MKTIEKLYEFSIEGLLDAEKEHLAKFVKKSIKDVLKDSKMEKKAIEALAALTGMNSSFIKEHLDEIKKL